MEPYLLQMALIFIAGLVVGIIIMLLVNKLKSGNISPASVKREYQDYQDRVEEHFEATSKKFQDMTEQYQDLYKHLSVGATSLCRPDSVAAALADNSESTVRIEKQEDKGQTIEEAKNEPSDKEEPSAKKEPSVNESKEQANSTAQENKVKDTSEASKPAPQNNTSKPEASADKK